MCQVTDPTPPLAVLRRRTLLRSGVALGVGAFVVTAAACNRGPTPAQITAEGLLPLADAAVVDELSARALAPRFPDYTAALNVIADQRGQHARALREEITRLDREIAGRIVTTATSSATPGGTSTAPSSTSASAQSASAQSAPAGTLAELRTALRTSARTAAAAAVALQGYSAGLSGSVSAAVTTMVEVQLR